MPLGDRQVQLAAMRARQGQLRSEGLESQNSADILDAYETDPEMPPLMRYELARRVGAGAANMVGGAMSAASMLPLPQGVQESLNSRGKYVSSLGDIPSTAPGTLKEIENVGDAAGYLGRQIAEQVPQVMASGAVGGAMGLASVPSRVVAYAAPAVAAFPREAGALYQEITDRTGLTGPRQKAVAIGGGLVSAGLNAIGGDSAALRNLTGNGKSFRVSDALRGMRPDLYKIAAGEAVSGAAKSGVSNVAPDLADSGYIDDNSDSSQIQVSPYQSAVDQSGIGYNPDVSRASIYQHVLNGNFYNTVQ